MPVIAKLNQERIERLQDVLGHVAVKGLTKLIASEGIRMGRPFFLDRDKWENKEDKRYWKYMETVWVPGDLVRENGKPLHIITAYQPVFRRMPVAKEETYAQLRDRIAKETGMLANYVMEQTSKEVNAFHLSNLDMEYVMSDSAKESIGLVGDGIFLNPKEAFEPRATFLTSFYEIKNQ
ncbi:hypothetical protein AYK26_02535 [Euryarchaeota archaeon SM23-78]|nr:MAG: hypothetical protein AYK26_02535 [Euryarchaeota archaeon SM23-78]MBW3000249.1 hypothetical protein [Candidatus Woesearchaeota archaeon]